MTEDKENKDGSDHSPKPPPSREGTELFEQSEANSTASAPANIRLRKTTGASVVSEPTGALQRDSTGHSLSVPGAAKGTLLFLI